MKIFITEQKCSKKTVYFLNKSPFADIICPDGFECVIFSV